MSRCRELVARDVLETRPIRLSRQRSWWRRFHLPRPSRYSGFPDDLRGDTRVVPQVRAAREFYRFELVHNSAAAAND